MTVSSTPGAPFAGRGGAAEGRRRARALTVRSAPPEWWPLAALLVIAAALRLSTLSLQSLWYDEAYTPVHVLHAGLGATLSAVAHSENTPPLWYVVSWATTRVLGSGVFALRLPSALAGIGLVGVGWAIGAELGSRRTAIALAALLAVNPLFVWYSQEARAYELYALAAGCSLLWFLRVWRSEEPPRPRPLALWSASSVLALLAHYFAVFLVVPEALLLARAQLHSRGRAARPWSVLAAAAPVAACGGALVALALAQGGRGTQWIGRWALSDRIVRVAGYYLTGANGAVLGHGLLALTALPLLAALVLLGLLWRRRALAVGERRGVAVVLGLGIVAILAPLALALAGADYLAPRNLIAAWLPLSAALAAIVTARAAGRAGLAIACAVCVAGLAVVIATDLSPRLQRPDWSAVARALRDGASARAIVTVEEGSAPLEYYLPAEGLAYLSVRRSVRVSEVDLVGFRPLRPGAIRPPSSAFTPAGRADVHGLLLYRFVAAAPQTLKGRFLRALAITPRGVEASEVLASSAVRVLR